MSIRVNVSGIDEVIERLTRYSSTLEQKKRIFLDRLAEIGVNKANIKFSAAKYDGDKDVSVTSMWIDSNHLQVIASGKSVLFIEFGSGPGGGGHPLAEALGYGPGTWSDDPTKGGKGHWQQPGGWYYAHNKKSTGNPPARAMYEAGKDMHEEVLTIAREVFDNG